MITFGIYGLYWYYAVHAEMKRATGEGIGGGVALLLALFVGPVVPFLTSSEAGKLQLRAGQQQTVSAGTGLWYFPGIFLLVLPIVWFVKTNGAINEVWKARGA